MTSTILMAYVVTAMIVSGAVSIAMVEKALGPGSDRFPCASPVMRWTIRFYALVLFNRAAVIGVGTWQGHPINITLDLILGTFGMCLTHGVLLLLLMRVRLPEGVWSRLERRFNLVQRVAATSAKPGPSAMLAAEGVHIVPDNPLPEDLIPGSSSRSGPILH